MHTKLESLRDLLNETSYPPKTKEAILSAYERNDCSYATFFRLLFPEMDGLEGGSLKALQVSGPSAGALGMQQGEHKAAPAVTPGQKFYTIGRARYKPFAAFPENEQRDWFNVLPLDLGRLKVLVQDIYDQDLTSNEFLDRLQDRWAPFCEQNVLAHSGLIGSEFSASGQTGRYTFDIKLVHQEPTRAAGLDINANISRSDAVEKLRAIRSVLTYALPAPFLKVLFRGWIHLNLDEENPNVDPFTDMTLEDFNSDYDEVFSALTQISDDNQSLEFRFKENGLERYEDLGGLFGGSKGELADATSSYLAGSTYGQKFSKLFDPADLASYKQTSLIHYQNPEGFLFANPFQDGLVIQAFGGSIKSLVLLLSAETQKPLYIAIPHAGPAYAHGRQECPTELLLDVDMAAEVIQHFRAKATMELPPLTAAQEAKFQTPYADALYEAMRSPMSEPVPHARCTTTGYPHVFYLRLTKL